MSGGGSEEYNLKGLAFRVLKIRKKEISTWKLERKEFHFLSCNPALAIIITTKL